MTYDIGIWEQIGSTVEWKARKLEQDIQGEIAKDRSLRGFHGVYPVPWQLREVLKQRAESWIQRLYDPCCEARKASGGELSLEFDIAVWAYWIEPFIMREVQTTADGYRASKLMELLLCAVGSTPEKRRFLKTGQKDCCVDVRNAVVDTWYSKLHHVPSKLEQAARAMSQYNAMEVRAARIAGDSRQSHLRHFLSPVRHPRLKFLWRPHLLICLICPASSTSRSLWTHLGSLRSPRWP